jgi:hypothetical protein
LVSNNWKDNAKAILDKTLTKGAMFVQGHSPGGNPIAGDSNSEILIDATIRSIDICGILGIPNIVVHAYIFLSNMVAMKISGNLCLIYSVYNMCLGCI